jgi:hypothetical protein
MEQGENCMPESLHQQDSMFPGRLQNHSAVHHPKLAHLLHFPPIHSGHNRTACQMYMLQAHSE